MTVRPDRRRRVRHYWPTSVRQQVVLYQAAWDASNESAIQDLSRPFWAVLGDSLSQSIGASAWDKGWVHRVSSGLTQTHDHLPNEPAILNFSRSGATTLDLLERQLVALESLAELGHRPTVTSLVIGTNDLLRRRHRQQLVGRFAEVLTRVPHGTVVTYLPQPVRLARQVNDVIDSATVKARLRPVSVRRLALLSPHNSASDLFHPNDRGYQILADTMLSPLRHAWASSSTTNGIS